MSELSLKADEVIKDPDCVYQLAYDHYLFLRDTSMNGSFKNMIEAINLLAAQGWEVTTMSVDSASMYVLCHNTRAKRKNQSE